MEKTAETRIKYDVGKILKAALPKALYLLTGYLSGICALPFGAYPFGFALLAAANKNALFVYVGLVISCFVGFSETTAAIFLGIYTAELLLRVLVRLTLDYPFTRGEKRGVREIFSLLFVEKSTYRVLVATVSAFALGSCFLLGSGFLYYDLFGLLVAVATAPLAAYVFCCFFEKTGVWREIGFLSVAAVCVYGASSLKIYGVSLAVLGALFLTFYVTHKRGLVRGLVTAITLGLVYSPVLAPVFVFGALLSALFMRISPALACFSTFIAGAAWGFYVKGIYALDGLFAGMLSACVLYSVFCRLSQRERSADLDEEKKKSTVTPCVVLGESELDGVRLMEMNRRMSAISDGLESLSGLFDRIKVRFPQRGELLRICEDAFASSCTGCPEYDRCRAQGIVNDEVRRLSDLLGRNRRVSASDVERELVRRCARLPDILDEINCNSGAREYERENGAQVFAPDYKALSRLLSKSMEEESEEYKIDKELSSRVCELLFESGACVSGAMVYGKRRRTVYIKGDDYESLERESERIFNILSREMPFALDEESIRVRKNASGGAMSVSEAQRITVAFTGRQQRAREESEYCGDSMTVFQNSDGRFFSLISDGMGSGRDAATVSEICTAFIRGMLEVGSMNEELLCMLNGFLCGRCEGSLAECSATVDIMEIDLVSGDTAFFKSGAAPSYVFREGNLFKLRSCTMPIGILETTDTKRFDFKLCEGDVVVMISDGVTGGKDECPWLFDLLRQNIESAGLERTADLILKYAIGHGSRDDISLAVMRVESA